MSIKAIVFDAYGTLYDIQSVASVTEESFPGYGDIITQVSKLRGIGPVIGTRTWGGVVGIDNRFSLADVVGLADCGATGSERFGRQQVPGRGVFDVDHVDQVATVSHAAQPAAPGALDQPRHQLPVARSPNQVGPQGTGAAARSTRPFASHR